MFYDEEGIFFLSHAYFMYKRLSHTSLASPPPLLLHAKKSSPYFTDCKSQNGAGNGELS